MIPCAMVTTPESDWGPEVICGLPASRKGPCCEGCYAEMVAHAGEAGNLTLAEIEEIYPVEAT